MYFNYLNQEITKEYIIFSDITKKLPGAGYMCKSEGFK